MINPNEQFDRLRMRVVRVPAWQIILFSALALAILVALAVVATGVFLIVFPIAVVAGWIYRLTSKSRRGTMSRPAPQKPSASTVIDGEYRVVTAEETRPNPPGA